MSWLDIDAPEEDAPKERGNFKLTPKELEIRPVFPAEWKQLSNEELCALAQGGNELAMNTLIWRNESFLAERALAVHEKSFSKVREYSVDFDDLMQAARIGFWKAINTFKPSRGTKLITYGGKCIENELKGFKGKYKRATKTERKGYRMEGGDQDGEESKGFNQELRPDEYKKRPEPMALARETSEEICRSVNSLEPRERKYLCYRFGYPFDEEKSQKRTAEHFFLHQVRAEKLEQKALRNFRHGLHWDDLDYWIDIEHEEE